MQNYEFGFGWERDLPDHRDLSFDSKVIKDIHANSPINIQQGKLPDRVDLSAYCSPIVHQGQLNTCTANAAVALLEYFENRVKQTYTLASRLFVFKTAKNLIQNSGPGGIQIRTAMKAMALFGVPPEKYWPYEPTKVAEEPPAFCYAYADAFRALKYYRLDTNPDGKKRLETVKRFVHSKHVSMFGFSVYNMGNHPNHPSYNGEIWYPKDIDAPHTGHAMVIVGYDDKKEIHDDMGKVTSTGAIKVRNSWGKKWGQQGYGWMPYKYIENKLATDIWSVTKAEYKKGSLIQT